ncbi:MAG: hypothetical protein GY701_07450 [Sulfitobacter sp.]|nr:hypothetical protein [Sulfitobacter sp.]MCP4086671.1 hypothetical protein [Actinomycetes bacterium]
MALPDLFRRMLLAGRRATLLVAMSVVLVLPSVSAGADAAIYDYDGTPAFAVDGPPAGLSGSEGSSASRLSGPRVDPVEARARLVAESVAPRLTGTVWDDVVETGARYPGTEVPRSFRLGLDDGTEVWVHPNATEHLAERVLNAGATGPVTTQSQIRSLQTAVSEVNRQGVSLGQMYNVNGWQLQFSIRSTDDLVVVNQLLYTG